MKPEDYEAPEGQQETLEYAKATLVELNKKAVSRDNYALIYNDGSNVMYNARACMSSLFGTYRELKEAKKKHVTYFLYRTIAGGDGWDSDEPKNTLEKKQREPYLTWLFTESPFRHIFVQADATKVHKEGVICDARYPFDLIYQGCAAIRYMVEETDINIKVWNKLVEAGVDKGQAFVLCHYLATSNGKWKLKEDVTYAGHSVIPCLRVVGKTTFKNFLLEDMSHFPKDRLCDKLVKTSTSFMAWGEQDDAIEMPPLGTLVKKKDYWGRPYFEYTYVTWKEVNDFLPIMKEKFFGKA